MANFSINKPKDSGQIKITSHRTGNGKIITSKMLVRKEMLFKRKLDLNAHTRRKS
jgi:hypothetical protein